MSEKKTKITHSQDKARFLGYDITTAKNSALMQSSGHTEMPIQAVGQEQPVPDDKGASGIVASILEEKSGAGYGTNCSQLNTVISVIEAMYLCEGMWLFPFCAEDRFFNQPSCIYARAKPRRAKYTHRTKLRFVLCVFRPCRGLSRRIRRWVRKRTPICPLTLALEVKERVAGADCCIG